MDANRHHYPLAKIANSSHDPRVFLLGRCRFQLDSWVHLLGLRLTKSAPEVWVIVLGVSDAANRCIVFRPLFRNLDGVAIGGKRLTISPPSCSGRNKNRNKCNYPAAGPFSSFGTFISNNEILSTELKNKIAAASQMASGTHGPCSRHFNIHYRHVLCRAQWH